MLIDDVPGNVSMMRFKGEGQEVSERRGRARGLADMMDTWLYVSLRTDSHIASWPSDK